MTTFELYDVVRLRVSKPHVDRAAKGAVVMIYDCSPPEYEVEFCDNEGRTIALLTLRADDLERVPPNTDGSPSRD